MRRIALVLSVLAAAGFAFAATSVADEDTHTYKLETYNAFGIVEGSEVKVAGVNAGTVKALEVSEDKTALIEVELTGPLAALGVDTECSSEPQSLIAEYFIDCQPAGEPAEDGSTLKNKISQTVQPDLVQNALREPFKDRLAILINEFGTALAGNPENLNEAVRLGAPALEDLHEALRILAQQNNVIRDLNVDSDRIISTLAERREDVSAFIVNAGEAAAASAERSDDLSRNFDLLDNFLAELEPTMVELANTARETTPLLGDLRVAAPHLNELATSLPAFNRAAEDSLVSLGSAAQVGEDALKRGIQNGTFKALRNSFKNAPNATELLKDFFDDIDDPRRIVELDDRAAKACDDKTASCYNTGREGPTGYLGTEGILNYAYYLGGALSQYDSVGHLLHFSLYDVFAGPCGAYNPQQSFPAEGGGRTDVLLEAEQCVSGLGQNQPGITEGEEETDLGVPPYDPKVCPDGATDLRQVLGDPTSPLVCDDPDSAPRAAATSAEATDPLERGTGEDPSVAPPPDPAAPGGDFDLPELPELPGSLPVDPADSTSPDLDEVLDNLPGLGREDSRSRAKSERDGSGQAATDLLDFLFTP